MPQAIVDPIELRRFAQNLKKFNQELEERMTALRAVKLAGRDVARPGAQEVCRGLRAAHEGDRQVRGDDERTCPVLDAKAERIEEYLQQR